VHLPSLQASVRSGYRRSDAKNFEAVGFSRERKRNGEDETVRVGRKHGIGNRVDPETHLIANPASQRDYMQSGHSCPSRYVSRLLGIELK